MLNCFKSSPILLNVRPTFSIPNLYGKSPKHLLQIFSFLQYIGDLNFTTLPIYFSAFFLFNMTYLLPSFIYLNLNLFNESAVKSTSIVLDVPQSLSFLSNVRP